MFARVASPVVLLLMGAVLVACPADARAQAFSANYQLTGPSVVIAWPESGPDTSWFARVDLGHAQSATQWGTDVRQVVGLAGGYRWRDGESLSLHLTHAPGQERLGLSVRYDWPRYFVRLSSDPKLNEVPQDRLRFSAGVRF